MTPVRSKPWRASRATSRRARRRSTSSPTRRCTTRSRACPTAVFGVAGGGPGDSGEALLRDADAAMYSAKEKGRGRVELFDSEARVRAAGRLAAEGALRRAVEREEFVVLYQPIVSVTDTRVVGAEALVRWDPPGEQRVSPTEFIPLAEETGLIVP